MHRDFDDTQTSRLAANIHRIQTRIDAARSRGDAAAEAVELVVVTKSQDPSIFGPLHAAGVRAVGENRVRSAALRRPAAPEGLVWHGIGHLQRNKARTALGVFDVFHALDSIRLADRLEGLLAEAGRRWPVYLQVNASQEPAKGGIEPDEALEALRTLADRPHLDPQGFMTMAQIGAAESDLRATFRTLREIRDEGLRLGAGPSPATGLSMGMTDDFEIAIEEGATVVRVGRAVFDGVDISAAPGPSAKDWRGAAGERS